MQYNIPNNFYRISLKALILDEQKRFLLAREENGMWEMLGGGLDYGEGVEDNLRRELMEETGMEILEIAKSPSYFVTGPHITIPGSHKALVIYEVKVKDLNFKKSEECVELKFFTAEEAFALEDKLYPSIIPFTKQFDPKNHS
jgi:8-oxo-dGTP pyrophosphatase MutT (NUDIX family)